jgi:hypothetical protein
MDDCHDELWTVGIMCMVMLWYFFSLQLSEKAAAAAEEEDKR